MQVSYYIHIVGLSNPLGEVYWLKLKICFLQKTVKYTRYMLPWQHRLAWLGYASTKSNTSSNTGLLVFAFLVLLTITVIPIFIFISFYISFSSSPSNLTPAAQGSCCASTQSSTSRNTRFLDGQLELLWLSNLSSTLLITDSLFHGHGGF